VKEFPGVSPEFQESTSTSEMLRSGGHRRIQNIVLHKVNREINKIAKIITTKRLFRVAPIKFEPEKNAIRFNSGNYRNFKDESGTSAIPYLLVFQTKE
jgi:hypothetical protein